jgi:hypothetical protein
LLTGISVLLFGCASNGPHAPLPEPVLSLSTTSFNFNTVVVGKSATETLQISNTGNAPLTLDSVSLKSQQFTLTGPSLPRTILPAQCVAYTVDFVPTASGNFSAAVQITSNASTAPTSVSLAGVAEKAFAALQVTPSSISFGNLKVQSTSTQNVTLQNTGDINLVISGIAVAGAGFGYSDLSPGYSLPPNQSVTFQIWFRPQTSGPASGKVSILSASLANPTSVPVSGDGVSSTPPPVAVQHTVNLSWKASTSAVTGYRVYRSAASGSGYSPLTSIIADLTFSDDTVTSGDTYYYVVTAVDSIGDESPYSNQATAAVPTP